MKHKCPICEQEKGNGIVKFTEAEKEWWCIIYQNEMTNKEKAMFFFGCACGTAFMTIVSVVVLLIA